MHLVVAEVWPSLYACLLSRTLAPQHGPKLTRLPRVALAVVVERVTRIAPLLVELQGVSPVVLGDASRYARIARPRRVADLAAGRAVVAISAEQPSDERVDNDTTRPAIRRPLVVGKGHTLLHQAIVDHRRGDSITQEAALRVGRCAPGPRSPGILKTVDKVYDDPCVFETAAACGCAAIAEPDAFNL